MARVLVPLAPGFEELEAVTIIDLLVRADIKVISAGLNTGPIKGSRGVVIQPDTTLEEVLNQPFDMIVLPGGLPGADHLAKDSRIQRLLKQMSAEKKYTAAICAAPMALASAGLLSGREATSYPGVLAGLEQNDILIRDQKVVQDGKIITSQGPGTAMEFALTLIELLSGRDKRDEVAAALLFS